MLERNLLQSCIALSGKMIRKQHAIDCGTIKHFTKHLRTVIYQIISSIPFRRRKKFLGQLRHPGAKSPMILNRAQDFPENEGELAR